MYSPEELQHMSTETIVREIDRRTNAIRGGKWNRLHTAIAKSELAQLFRHLKNIHNNEEEHDFDFRTDECLAD